MQQKVPWFRPSRVILVFAMILISALVTIPISNYLEWRGNDPGYRNTPELCHGGQSCLSWYEGSGESYRWNEAEANWAEKPHNSFIDWLKSDGKVHAQQQTVSVATAAAGPSMSVTSTSVLTTTAVNLGIAGSSAIPVTGTHDLYGWYFNNEGAGGGTCWVQIFDAQTSGITVGTTRPKFAIPVGFASTTGDNIRIFVSPIPLFNMTSTLGAAATLTSTGSAACIGTITGSLFYK